MPKHWLLGEETHFGRGYFSLLTFEQKTAALSYARSTYGLTASEMQALRAGRVEFFEIPGRAQALQCIALELVGCDCRQPEVHDG